MAICEMLVVVHRVVATTVLGHIVPDCEVHLTLFLGLSPLLDFTAYMSMGYFFVQVLNLVLIRFLTIQNVVLIMTYLIDHMKVFVRILVGKAEMVFRRRMHR